jgi:hypothetical protein
MQMMKSNSQHPIQLSKKLQNVYTAVANSLLIRKIHQTNVSRRNGMLKPGLSFHSMLAATR